MADDTTFGTGDASASPWGTRLSRTISAVILLVVVIAAAIWLLMPKSATVPDVTGSTLEVARTTIENAGYKVGVVSKVETDKMAAGLVTAQTPAGRSSAAKGAVVDLVLAEAPTGVASAAGTPGGGSVPKGSIAVPNVLGKTQNEAGKSISSNGLLVTFSFTQSGSPVGSVVSQFPAPGAIVPAGTVVDVVLSSGLPSGSASAIAGGITVPSVLGLSQSAATSKLAAAGWGASVTFAPATAAPQGVVFYQSPGGETLVSSRRTVTIWVSRGTPTYYPDPYASPPLNK